jgi:flavin-dependent dehydrogenase
LSADTLPEHIIKFDIIIVGGGLAGLTSAIHLSKYNFSVLVIEKNKYPKHKVCGEYVSNEVSPYLQFLDIDPMMLGAKKITRVEISTPKSKVINTPLSLGGFGISRYKFDHFLSEKALSNGAQILHDSVTDIKFLNEEFTVSTKQNSIYISKIVIGAYGKRAALDIKLERNFIKEKSSYLAVKTHAVGDFPDDLVALHNFKGGYCGVSKIENDHINLCYITDFESFKKYKDIHDFQENVIYENKYLKDIFTHSKSDFQLPLTISQISFASKTPVEQHMLMCGDTAGMIHPLCGNGMSMAIRSAQIVSRLIIKYFNTEIKSRAELEKAYLNAWNKEFGFRLKVGRFIALFFGQNKLAEVIILVLKMFPGLLPKIIQLTHGKPMEAK